MTRQIGTLARASGSSILRLTVLGILTVTAGLPQHASHVPAKLVQDVRDANRRYIDVNAATAANYTPYLGCISGPDHGAMGVHYVNFPLLAKGVVLDVAQPQALVYEPTPGGMQLVAVEYILDAAAWLATHNNVPPVLEGQTFQFNPAPNRYALPAFYELHVWAWRTNDNGAFVDWNNDVSCEGQ